MVASSSSSNDEPRQPPIQAEMRDMLSTLSVHLTALGRAMVRSDAKSPATDGADNGFGIITLAGDNKGATMKADMEELLDTLQDEEDDDGGMHTYTNSNYQAVNNSILVGGSCSAEDPGVHVVISEYIEEDEEDLEKMEKKIEKEKNKKKKEEKKEKKKKKKKEDEKKKTKITEDEDEDEDEVDDKEEDEEGKEKRKKDEKENNEAN